MLKTIAFYILGFWFVNFESRTILKIRATLSALLSTGFLVSAIITLITELNKQDGLPWIAAIILIFAVLYFWRFCIDYCTLTFKTRKFILGIHIAFSAIFSLGFFLSAIFVLVIQLFKIDGNPFSCVILFLLALACFLALGRNCNAQTSINTRADAAERKKIQESEEARKKAIEQEKTTKSYNTLIEQCGTRFFIRYYKQIKNLPMRDIEISENYPYQEKLDRLTAAKKIIDTGLTEFAVNEILKTCSEFLTESEIAQAKEILASLPQSDQSQSTDTRKWLTVDEWYRTNK